MAALLNGTVGQEASGVRFSRMTGSAPAADRDLLRLSDHVTYFMHDPLLDTYYYGRSVQNSFLSSLPTFYMR